MSDQIGPDGLTDRQRAALGATRNNLGVSNAPPPPTPQPAPVQVQQPQPTPERERGIIGILKGRANQIDKAAGYACGGKIKAHAQGGKIMGPGTPTSDSIAGQVRESGEPILVSTEERILSKEQDALLGRIAQMLGFESVDALLESGTGKPVGPTIKGGKKALFEGGKIRSNNNVEDEFTRAMQETRNSLSLPSMGTNNSAAQGGIYKDVGLPSISVGAGQAPTIYDNGGLDAGTVQRGIDTMRGQMANGQPKLSSPVVESGRQAISGQLPEQAPSGPSVFDKDPLSAMTSAINRSMASSDAAEAKIKKLYPAGTFDESSKVGQQSASQPTIKPEPAYGMSPDPQRSSIVGGISAGSAAQRQAVDNSFTAGGKSYTANPTSQDGITRVTARGTNPLYTNIAPEQAVAGLKNQTIGGDAASVQEGLDRYARANATRGQMIDSMVAANGGNGIAVLPDYAAQSGQSAMMDKFNSLAEEAKKSGRGGQRILGEYAGLVRQQMGNDANRYSADVQAQRAAGHDQVLMRGQDLNAANELARMQGNPLDNEAKQLGINNAKRIDRLHDAYQVAKTPEEQMAIAAKIAGLSGKGEPREKYIALPNRKVYNDMGNVIDEVPGGALETTTGRTVGGQQKAASNAPADAIAMLKSDPKKYGAAFKEKYGYLPEGM